MTDRYCADPGCAKPLVRRPDPGDIALRHTERMYCDNSCRHAHRRGVLGTVRSPSIAATIAHDANVVRHCAASGCRRPLVRRGDELVYRFMRREYCDAACRHHAANAARRRDNKKPCPICRSPYGPNRGGRFAASCGAEACVDATRPRSIEVGWPQITGEIDFGGGFARQNVVTKDGGFYRIPPPPERQSLTGCTAAMLVSEDGQRGSSGKMTIEGKAR